MRIRVERSCIKSRPIPEIWNVSFQKSILLLTLKITTTNLSMILLNFILLSQNGCAMERDPYRRPQNASNNPSLRRYQLGIILNVNWSNSKSYNASKVPWASTDELNFSQSSRLLSTTLITCCCGSIPSVCLLPGWSNPWGSSSFMFKGTVISVKVRPTQCLRQPLPPF